MDEDGYGSVLRLRRCDDFQHVSAAASSDASGWGQANDDGVSFEDVRYLRNYVAHANFDAITPLYLATLGKMLDRMGRLERSDGRQASVGSPSPAFFA